MVDLGIYRSELTELCHSFVVKRLDLVGSAAREDFQLTSSDIDVLIEFNGTDELFDRYFGIKFELERIFGRKVDLIQSGAVKNPHLRASFEQDRIAIYAA